MRRREWTLASSFAACLTAGFRTGSVVDGDPADLDDGREVDGGDLAAMLAAWP